MEIIEYQSGAVIARKNDKCKYWYLVQQGTVIQKLGLFEVRLEKNSIIGILERDIYLCDYIAGEDTALAAFSCENSEELKKVLAGQEKIRHVFLKAAIEQRHQLLCLYSELYSKTRKFHTFVETLYNDYVTLCGKYKVDVQNFSKMEHFKPLRMQHRAEIWEVNNSVSIMKNYLKDYIQLMEKDDSLTVGTIMEAAAQMRRFTMGICEMESYLSYNRDILIGEHDNDIFKLYADLAVETNAKKLDIEPVTENINQIVDFAEKGKFYNVRMVARRLREYNDFLANKDKAAVQGAGGRTRMEIDITQEDSLSHILEYAGYKDEEIDSISDMIKKYRNLPDMSSTDNETYALRRKITAVYYEIYYKVFIRAVANEESMTPVLEMFLNFGYMDLSYVGEERAKALYDLCAHLDICNSDHIYTIYQWLKGVYSGEKETSKNEFDQNFAAYLTEQCKTGKITQEEMKADVDSAEKRVEFEIKNMFTSVNKMTYGKVTTFCPILCEYDLINSVEKILVTAEKLENALNEIRKIDYSVFYREVPFYEAEKGITNERVMKEILPDIILMPNAGTKVMMWQETSDVRSDTPARFMFPIFTAVDLDDLMLEVVGRYRWEMCRKIQGVHWNDVREKSLTAEYCSYLQFYRKNSELSTDAKEKIKNTLLRVKNSYREVFVRDYINWIKFESKGSFRLNKVSRDILIRFCPFVKSIRDELKINPLYQGSIARFETETTKKLQRYTGLYNKYIKAGGENGGELKETMMYYEM